MLDSVVQKLQFVIWTLLNLDYPCGWYSYLHAVWYTSWWWKQQTTDVKSPLKCVFSFHLIRFSIESPFICINVRWFGWSKALNLNFVCVFLLLSGWKSKINLLIDLNDNEHLQKCWMIYKRNIENIQCVRSWFWPP